jgi:hypothetical protein
MKMFSTGLSMLNRKILLKEKCVLIISNMEEGKGFSLPLLFIYCALLMKENIEA